jgi:hypothetical protein
MLLYAPPLPPLLLRRLGRHRRYLGVCAHGRHLLRGGGHQPGRVHRPGPSVEVRIHRPHIPGNGLTHVLLRV